MNTTIDITALLRWSEPKEVNTSQGRRLLRKAAPTEQFSALWKSPAKAELQKAGLGWSKDRNTGAWEVCWWQPVSAEQAARENAAVAASRAVDADVAVPAPDGLAYLPFQRAGVTLMAGRAGTLLADQMGLGKTVQVVGLVNYDPSIRKVLIVCPASLKVNWRNELARWLVRPLTIAVQKAGEPWAGSAADVVVLNYDILAKYPQIYATEWDLLAADEAHFVKNPKAKRTQLLLGCKAYKDRQACPGVRAKRRVFMTGTPVLNKPVELFPLLRSLEPGKWTFKDQVRYCAGVRGRWGWDFSGAAHLDELQNRLRASVMVRRLRAEVLKDLPPKRRQIVEIAANGAADVVREERESYARSEATLARLKAEALAAELADDEAAYSQAADNLRRASTAAFTEIAKLRHAVALAKLPYALDHIKDALEEVDKLVLFAHHLDVVSALAAEFGALTISGETPIEQRQAIVDQFNSDPSRKVLVLGIKAAGVGLSVKASVEIFVELDWTPGVVSQAEDRCYGVGRGVAGEPLLVQHLVLEGSLDARIVRTIVRKQDVADRALDKGAGAVAGAEPVLAVEVGSVMEEVERAAATKREAEAQFPPALREHVHAGLRVLAALDPDRATFENQAGFNAFDGEIGHALAGRAALTAKMAAVGLRLVRKYRRQLGEAYADRLAELAVEPVDGAANKCQQNH